MDEEQKSAILVSTEEARAKGISRSHHINNLWRLNGKCGLAAEAMFVSLRQQEVFIEALKKEFEDVEISIHEVVENPKREGFLTSCLICKKLTLFGPISRTEAKKNPPSRLFELNKSPVGATVINTNQ